jgi:hypothetical protein
MTRRLGICFLFFGIVVSPAARADVITFESVNLPASGYLNGDPGNLSAGGSVSVPFVLEGVSFSNTFGIDASWGFSATIWLRIDAVTPRVDIAGIE